jgi:hypothetical protein
MGFARGALYRRQITMSLKDAYVAKMEAQLKEWSAELSSLKAKMEKATAQGKIEYHKQIEASQAKQEALKRKLEELKKAGEDRWEALKTGVEGAWNEFKTSINPKSQ